MSKKLSRKMRLFSAPRSESTGNSVSTIVIDSTNLVTCVPKDQNVHVKSHRKPYQPKQKKQAISCIADSAPIQSKLSGSNKVVGEPSEHVLKDPSLINQSGVLHEEDYPVSRKSLKSSRKEMTSMTVDKIEKVVKNIPQTFSNRTIQSYTKMSLGPDKVRPPCSQSVSKKTLIECGIRKEHTLKIQPQLQKLKLTGFREWKPRNIESYCRSNVDRVKTAANIIQKTEDKPKEVLCVEMDVDNPLNLDFKGHDFKYTFQVDEQDIQIKREFLISKRKLNRRAIKKKTFEFMKKNVNAKQMEIPGFYKPHLEFEKPRDNVSTEDTVEEVEIVPMEWDPTKTAHLVRSDQKPLATTTIQLEVKRRKDRLRTLFRKKYRKDRKREKLAKEKEERRLEEGKMIKVGANDAKLLYDNGETPISPENDDAVIKENRMRDLEASAVGVKAENEVKLVFPRSQKLIPKFKHNLKKERMIQREKALLKKSLYAQSGMYKDFEDADMEISSISKSPTSITDDSSDDEDFLFVGREDRQKFFLRGFHDRLATEPRGLMSRRGGRAPRLCITRSQWFEEGHSLKKKRPFFRTKHIPVMIKEQAPDDPHLQLFRQIPPPVPCIDKSAIRENIELGKQKACERQKRLTQVIKTKNPKKIKVKKFDLQRYLYGEEVVSDTSSDFNIALKGKVERVPLEKHLELVEKRRIADLNEKVKQRLNYLGIPYKDAQSQDDIACDSDTVETNDKWVPEKETYLKPEDIDPTTIQLKTKKTVFPKTEIPAGLFREPIIQHNPKRPRQPPENLNDVPALKPIPPDEIMPTNLHLKQNPFLEGLELRHHHEHLNPIQTKDIAVKYHVKIPEIIKEDRKVMENDVEVTEVHKKPRISDHGKEEPEDIFVPKNDIDLRNEFGVPSEESFVGKDEFLKAVKAITSEVKNKLSGFRIEQFKFTFDKEDFKKKVEAELESIQSCASSLESSVCTNLTENSGSFLVIQDTKLPLDYIRKSLVPFEEMERTRFRAKTRTSQTGENPFSVDIFAGKSHELRVKVLTETDNFYTSSTRPRQNLKQRLEVQPIDLKTVPIGPEKNKNLHLVATDLDESYMTTYQNASNVKQFKFKSATELCHQALRTKFESWIMHTQAIEKQNALLYEEKYFKDANDLKEMILKFFANLQKQVYEYSIKRVSASRLEFEKSASLKVVLSDLEKHRIRLSMKIIFMEDDWIQRTRLQNFHYLIMKNSWREEHDWIHRKEDGTLESYKESINNRNVANIRKRDRDDPWAIKEFYDKHFLKNPHPIEIVIPDANAFNHTISRLQSRTFVCLLEMHFTLWLVATFQEELRVFIKKSTEFIELRTKFVKERSMKKYFLEDRARKLEKKAKILVNKPLYNSIVSHSLRIIKPLTDAACERVLSDEARADIQLSPDVDRLSKIFQNLLEIFEYFETVPMETRISIENNYRKRYQYRKRISRQAYLIEKRIGLSLAEIKKNLAPPWKRPKDFKKQGRLHLKKKIFIKPPPAKDLTEKEQIYLKAFEESDRETDCEEESDEDIRRQQIKEDFTVPSDETNIPFYFDHFLRMKGYEPDYNFVTEVEQKYGSEDIYCRYKWLLPDVNKKLDNWKENVRRKMETDIKKTPQLYEVA